MIRHVLAIGVILFVISMMMNCYAQSAKKEIGLQLWSVREDMKKDATATIAALGKMGYSFVEAAGYADGLFYGMKPVVFRQLLNDHGLQFTASHTGRPLPDVDNWESTMKWWDACIDAHVKAGVKYIVQPSMDKKGYGSLTDLKRYCDYFNTIGEKCNEKGIRFGYHNHDKEFEMVDGVVRYDYMLKNTDPGKVMFQLDLYWIMKGGKEAITYFNTYPGRFELWHVKDEKELGESGLMDFEPIFKASEVSGMQYYIVEVERYNYTPLESVRKSLEFLVEASYVN